MNRLIALTAALTVALTIAAVAQATRPAGTGIHWGESRPLGAGQAAAWVAIDVDGSPASLGVSIDEAALQSARGAELEAVLPLPAEAALAGAAGGKTAFRVRYDRERRAYLVMLDGLPPAAAAPGARSAQVLTH